MKLSEVRPNLLVHEVAVRPLLGESSNGKVWGDPFVLPCMAQGQVRRIRNTEGDTVVATLTLYADPGYAEQIPTGSLITWRGGDREVLTSVDHDDGGLGAPQHTEVACQ